MQIIFQLSKDKRETWRSYLGKKDIDFSQFNLNQISLMKKQEFVEFLWKSYR